MKISELIENLTDIYDTNGDIDVVIGVDGYSATPSWVDVDVEFENEYVCKIYIDD